MHTRVVTKTHITATSYRIFNFAIRITCRLSSPFPHLPRETAWDDTTIEASGWDLAASSSDPTMALYEGDLISQVCAPALTTRKRVDKVKKVKAARSSAEPSLTRVAALPQVDNMALAT